MSSDGPAAETAAQAAGRSVAVSTEEQRRAKLERLRAEGVNPYPHAFPGRTHVDVIAREHDPAELGEGEHEGFSYRVMGRITGKRGHGKTAFLDVRDITGTIQAYARKDVLGEEAFARVEALDIGDLVGIEGPLHVTKRGQLAIGVRECTLLEKFVGGADYNGVMEFIEGLVSTVVEEVMGTTKVMRDGVEIDFAAPWPRVRLRDELLREIGLDIYEANRDELAEAAGDAVGPDDDWAGVVDTLQGKFVEPKLIQPTYIVDLPIDIWPLVKVHPESPRVCEAFDGIVAGMEIVGGGTDLNDPVEQRERFIKQRQRQESGAEPDPHPNDEEFVRALEYGMPPASGCGLGIDRLLMIMTGANTLRDVIIYPAMRQLSS